MAGSALQGWAKVVEPSWLLSHATWPHAPPEMSLSFQDSCARWSYAPPDEYPRMVYQVQVMALGFQNYGSQMAPLEAFSVAIQFKNQS